MLSVQTNIEAADFKGNVKPETGRHWSRTTTHYIFNVCYDRVVTYDQHKYASLEIVLGLSQKSSFLCWHKRPLLVHVVVTPAKKTWWWCSSHACEAPNPGQSTEPTDSPMNFQLSSPVVHSLPVIISITQMITDVLWHWDWSWRTCFFCQLLFGKVESRF